jgi:hypothetical protein
MDETKAIEFLSSLKYGDRALTEARIEHDKTIDEICLLLNGYVKKPERVVEDVDCPNGVCGTGGRV